MVPEQKQGHIMQLKLPEVVFQVPYTPPHDIDGY